MSYRFQPLLVVALVAAAACGTSNDAGETGETEELRLAGSPVESEAVPADALARARATADALTSELGGLLLSTLQAEGPLAAVQICSDTAQTLTARHAAEGTYVRRVSDRVRNPANSPDEAEAAQLALLASEHGRGELPGEVVRIVQRGGIRTLHYMRPIVVAPPCLTCHGPADQIPAEVRAVIEQRYPQDNAVGYAAGDLRGAVSVRVALEQQ